MADFAADTHHGPDDLPGNAFAVLFWDDAEPPARWTCAGVVTGAANEREAATVAAKAQPGLANRRVVAPRIGKLAAPRVTRSQSAPRVTVKLTEPGRGGR